jgi:putative oxidoreductase
MTLIKRSLVSRTVGTADDLTLLAVRLAAGGMMLFGHGWGKLANYAEYSAQFPDPIGAGPQLSLILTIFAEVVCAGLLMLGLLTRFAAANLAFTMAVAALIVHAADPFARKEMALLYLALSLVPLLRGGGRFSIDRALS